MEIETEVLIHAKEWILLQNYGTAQFLVNLIIIYTHF